MRGRPASWGEETRWAGEIFDHQQVAADILRYIQRVSQDEMDLNSK